MLLRSIGIAALAGTLILSLSFAAGCGDDDRVGPGAVTGDGGADGAPSAPLSPDEQACFDAETAYCKRFQVCDPFNLKLNWGDLTTCVANNTKVCLAQLATPSSGLTVANLPACGSGFDAVACADFRRFVLPAACGTCVAPLPAVDAGTPVPLGETCDPANDRCDPRPGEVCAKETSKCTKRTFVGNGASCGTLPDGSIAACAGGHCFEVVAGGSVVCKTDAPYDSACDDVRGPKCAYPGTCISGTCQAGPVTCQ